ncbi:MAG TPA: 2OG-Fe(II) oxygenase family protein [Candidatus Binatia bacterium]|jgi:hypothetical protein|nr:2OG-Fe(II) oxygenase family protein [Candidatus Binatia bacterium]
MVLLLYEQEARRIEKSFFSTGYLEVPNALPDQRFFDHLYGLFEEFIEAIQNNLELERQIDAIGEEWLHHPDNFFFFSEAPPKFQDRTRRDDKADKLYAQFYFEFFCFLTERYGDLLGKFRSLRCFYSSLACLHYIALGVFLPLIRALDRTNPGLERRLFPEHRVPPIMIKILRYNSNTNWGTLPHYDKSGLSLIMNSDDANDENFVVGRHGDGILKPSDLKQPVRTSTPSNGRTSGIVIPGMCLQEAGFRRLKPTPHAVLPVTKSTNRHAVVAFWLVPEINPAGLITNVEFEGDTSNGGPSSQKSVFRL